jgi:hypothetical protein
MPAKRQLESRAINRSLLALRSVLNSLYTQQPYVPVRDSKLTCLLHDAL